MKYSREEIELVRKSSFFDAKWYLAEYPDVSMLGMDPAEHYLALGARLNRDPSPAFSTMAYLVANKDVQKSGVNPLIHYERRGRKEKRQLSSATISSSTPEERVRCKRILTRRNAYWDRSRQERFLRDLSSDGAETSATTVSVIMPTRNRADCIGRAVQSVIDQSHRNWELLVIDDGGTDNTADIIASFADSRIRYVHTGINRGVSSARNAGLKIATGEWVFFLDSDNVWFPDMLGRMLTFTARHGLSAAYCAANLEDERGNTKTVLYADFDYESCLEENFIDLNCFCVARNFSQLGFDENLRRLVDWDFILRIGARTRIMGAPFIGVGYYDGEGHGRVSRTEYRDHDALLQIFRDIRTRAKADFLDVDRRPASGSVERIAVVLHVFHRDVVDECLDYVANIDRPFDLYVTTSLPPEDEAIGKIMERYPFARVFQFPNIGSDIAAFAGILSTLANYDLVCKIHTKRDAGSWGALWRKHLIEPLLVSRAAVTNVIEAFARDRNLVFLGSREFYKSGERNSIAATLEQVRRIAQEGGWQRHLDRNWAFFAGSMFWFRPHVLQGLARYLCDTPSYSKTFKSDGAPEHGIERLLGIVGYDFADAAVGLSTVRPDKSLEISVGPLDQGHTRDGVSVTLDRLKALEGQGG